MSEKSNLKFKRILFKVSGEALMGDKGFGHDVAAITKICDQIISAYKLGCEICVVVGGGNIFRGVSQAAEGLDRVTADYMGMLATCINGLALQSAPESRRQRSRSRGRAPCSAPSGAATRLLLPGAASRVG